MDAAVKKKVHRNFTFIDAVTKDTVTVRIPEVVDPSYGMYVWPAAPVLAQYIWYHRDQIQGKRILELGAGTSLPGIVAAKIPNRNNRVILSDAAHLTDCLNNCLQSCKANALEDKIKVIGLTWGQFDPEIVKLESIDLVLGSDCFYDPKDFEDILVTVAYLLERNPRCEFWTTYQDRSSDRTLEHLLTKWNLLCRRIPLWTFEADKDNIADSTLPGSHDIEMLVIERK